MNNFFSKTYLRLLFIRILIVLILSLGGLLLLFGILNLLFTNYIFDKIILPLANMFSQTGNIRQVSTAEFLYREWLGLILYIPTIGLGVLAFGFLWNKLENKIKEKGLPADFYIERNHKYAKETKYASYYLIAIISITIIGAILRSINLNMSLWSDEIGSVINFIKPFRLWRYVELADSWIYSFLGFYSIKLFGETEIVIRLPAFILSIITIPAIYCFVKDFLSRKTALLASGLLCVSVFHIRYANEARGYSALALFSLLSSFLFLRIVSQKSSIKIKKDNFWFTLFTILGCLSHFYYIWVLLAQYLTVLSIFIIERVFYKRANTLKDYLACNILYAIVISLLIALIIYGPGLIPSFIKKYLFWKGAGETVSLGILGSLLTGTPSNLYGSFLIALIILGLLELWKSRQKEFFILFLFLVILPLIFIRISCQGAFSRYFIYMLPFLLIMLAQGVVVLTKKFSKPLRIFIALLLFMTFIAIQLPELSFYYQHRKSGIQDYRSMGQFIDRLAKKEDIVYAIGIGSDEAQYYIKKNQVQYCDEEIFFKNLKSGNNKIWLIVTFPELTHLYIQALRIRESAKANMKLLGYFPAISSELIVYVNKTN